MKNVKPLLGTTDEFSNAFPAIKNLEFEVIEHGEGVNKYNELSIFHQGNITHLLKCHNLDCKNYGIRIQPLLNGMIALKKTNKKETLFCENYDCDNYFDIEINIEYK